MLKPVRCCIRVSSPANAETQPSDSSLLNPRSHNERILQTTATYTADRRGGRKASVKRGPARTNKNMPFPQRAGSCVARYIHQEQLNVDSLAAEDSVQAVETIPEGDASSPWQLFPPLSQSFHTKCYYYFALYPTTLEGSTNHTTTVPTLLLIGSDEKS
ncbi:uncharacterized protein V6R79_018602 [Siganus canaliculatus]